MQALSSFLTGAVPPNVGLAVLIDRGSELGSKIHTPQEVSEVNHLNSRRGCCLVLSFRS
jgi:hypothetical protein